MCKQTEKTQLCKWQKNKQLDFMHERQGYERAQRKKQRQKYLKKDAQTGSKK